MKVNDIAKALLRAKQPWKPGLWSGQGFYAVYLKPGARLPSLDIEQTRLLYISNTISGCTLLQHFAPPGGDSVASDLRQSLGALLARESGLAANPGARLSSLLRLNATLELTPESEQRLSAWMEANLECAFIPFKGDACAVSWILISFLHPPLNLSGWKNPQAGSIRSLRRKCPKQQSAPTLAGAQKQAA